MATAAWSQLRAPPLYSGATDTPFGLPVHGCHVPDPWLTSLCVFFFWLCALLLLLLFSAACVGVGVFSF